MSATIGDSSRKYFIEETNLSHSELINTSGWEEIFNYKGDT